MQPDYILLTHERELERPTNTGQCVKEVLAERCKTVVWKRTGPDPWLLSLLDAQEVALVYPKPSLNSSVINETHSEKTFDFLILLDGTWQESQKIYNRSPYLKPLPRIEIDSKKKSQFKLRRNQKEAGLCTAECVAQLLLQHNEADLSTQLLQAFDTFQSAPRIST